MTGCTKIPKKRRRTLQEIQEDSLKSTNICRKCDEEKPISEFYPPRSPGVTQTWCKKCSNLNSEANRQKNLEFNNNRSRITRLKRIYGLSLDQYNDLRKSQNYCCALCDRHEDTFKVRLAVDHNHKTLEIRGLLCVDCNRNKVAHHVDGAELRRIADYVDKSTGLFAPPRSTR